MSVQSEITRLATAKAAIKTAIEGKGVTVPDATMLDGMSALIEAIETGGGNHGIIARDILTATESMTIYEVLNAVEVKATYKNSVFFMGCYDDVTPNEGSYTMGNYIGWHLGQVIRMGADTYQNGQKSFANFKKLNYNEGFYDWEIGSDGRIQRASVGSASCCIAAGGTIKFVEVAINFDTFQPDLTLWGAT